MKYCVQNILFLYFRVTERANPYFALQQRKGYGTKGLASLFVGTMDSVFDTKVSKIVIFSHSLCIIKI